MSEPVDYYSPLPKAMRRRPPLLVGFGVGIAAVSLVAMCFDYRLGMDTDLPPRVGATELFGGLAAAALCAVTLIRYQATHRERAILIVSIILGLLAVFVSTFMPRLNRN